MLVSHTLLSVSELLHVAGWASRCADWASFVIRFFSVLAGEVRGGAQEEYSESVLLYPGLQNLACQAIVTLRFLSREVHQADWL